MILRVKPPSVVMCTILVMLSIGTTVVPLIITIIFQLISGETKLGPLLGAVVSSILGIFVTRYTLWNLYGKELYSISEGTITYQTDYKYFKEDIKSMSTNGISFYTKPVGYEEDEKGTLIIESSEGVIESSIIMPLEQIDGLITAIKKMD